MTQAEALSILKTGANVFLTGEPGSGKTYTINRYIDYLRDHELTPAITASTGIAATHLGGTTIHAWSGLGVKTKLTAYDLDRLTENEKLVKRVKQAQVLIIDEVSMLAAQTLEMVNLICQELRHSAEPFGGLQVVLVGDFFQLPPVFKQEAKEENLATRFAYGAPVWASARFLVCYLSEQHRQGDNKLLEILSAIRHGQVLDRHRAWLDERSKSVAKIPTTLTKLFPHNVDVDQLNEQELERLPGGEQIFTMKTRGPALLVENLKRSCLSPETLRLKVGAQVMFTKNDPGQSVVNGTTGRVKNFRRSDGAPIVELGAGRTITVETAEWSLEQDGRILARLAQVPLRLAWAITVHKSQGLSLDTALIDLTRAFEYGQGYVALSRVRSLAGLYLLGWNERALEVHPEILAADKRFRTLSAETRQAFRQMSPERLRRLHQNFARTKI